ncbi:RloB family protein [Fibrella arboris]|uniref:RloB family protein n=1 Tax=Fibrella arboris TaxID=3242486 RepID=UPI003521291B
MTKKKRTLATSIFIACEGRNTEPIYFERIKEQVEEDGILAITIYPDREEENPKTDAIGLIKEAQSRLDDFDEVWAVFDKDGYTKHKEAFEEANKIINGKKINVAFSSIAFEQWVLLHFEKCSTAFGKSENIVHKLNADNYFQDYSKKANVDIYPVIKDKTNSAIENTAWLRNELHDQLSVNSLYELTCYTDVDVLVKRLLGIETSIIWASLNSTITVDTLSISPRLNNNSLILEITNTGQSSYLINPNNLADIIHAFDNYNNRVNLNIIATVLIVPGATEECTVLLPTDNSAEHCYFNHCQCKLRLPLS